MRSFKSSLPAFLVLFLLVSPLALRADQMPDQTDTLQQATQISYLDLQADPVLISQSDIGGFVSSQDIATEPILLEPIEISPIIEPIQILPIDGTPIAEPFDPTGSSAVTPEPSSMALLTTGMLCGMFFWVRRGSFAMTA